ncbi:carboxymuconolactone decarboxylase family protein [Acinetobacter sp. VNH17]|uniref:Carboxymuconolactone decarboxylase family protein n=1 Tax=Acinetobacter thutiue TaxID=2998078 RepID=A0ABT7WK41_9GAMM|nr:carboxymuconolactone decarboxylase family protein [Acinetobacter thutiue]MCY6410949.1 carboxymuconolactone decarboxylase family protein [Acinetobacter thutiue]MDN0013051.1 carboxymuconolactone decarboxylase family protein [Acinetobacter thutiue]
MTRNQINAVLMMSAISGTVLAEDKMQQQITRAEQLDIQSAPSSNFSGNANFARYPVMPSQGDVAPAIVNFDAGTITNWHIHPHGQYLIVTEGEGRTQEWGKPIQTIHKGDTIWCPPNVKHWHGASEHRAMSHIAITPVATDGKSVTWLEKVDLPTQAKPLKTPAKAETVQLSTKQLSLIPIAAFTAIGDLEKLKPALIKGLENGLTVNEIKEVFAHQYAYAGFPRALNGMLTFKSLLEERQKQGIKDIQGALPSTLPSDTDYYQLGIERLAYLNKSSIQDNSKSLFENFSPTMDYALKAHLFGYLFSRDNLAPLEREIIVVSTLSALGDVNAQLRSHLRITRNLGVDATQMQKIMTTLQQAVGRDLANNAQNVFKQLQ